MPRTLDSRRTRILTAATGGALAIGLIVGAMTMGQDSAEADTPTPVKNQAQEQTGQRVADIANSALTGAMQRIGNHVKKECAVSKSACAHTLDAVTELHLTWGEDFRIVFDKDGRWDTKPRNDK